MELLKLLSEYDAATKDHLSKVTTMHRELSEKQAGK